MVGLALRQKTGRNPEGRQRAACARDDGASANSVQVLQGQHSCQRTYAAAGTHRPGTPPARLSAKRQRRQHGQVGAVLIDTPQDEAYTSVLTRRRR